MDSDPERSHRPSRARIARAMTAALCGMSLTLTPLVAPSAGLAQSSGSAVVAPASAPPRLGPPDRPPPKKTDCITTLKVLKGFRKYVKRYSPNTSEKRLKELKRLLDKGKIRPNDLPAKVRRGAKLPDRFLHKTIRQIEEECRNAQ